MANFVSVIISGNAKPLQTALAKATVGMSAFQKQVAAGFIVAGAAATAFAVSAVKAAAKDQVVMKGLERQLKASTGATDAQIAASEKWLKTAGRASALGKTALIPGYQSLIVATKDATKAQDIMGVAIDTARARNLDLTAVSEALAKAYAGNTRGLRNLSPEMKKLIKDGATFGEVLKVLGDNFGGAASEYAKTFEGRLAILGNTSKALKKEIGYALLPIVESLIPAFQAVADVMQRNPKLVTAVAFAIGTLSAAFMAATAAALAWKVAAVTTTLINGALSTSFTTLQVASGGVLLALGAAAALFVKYGLGADSATKSTREFNDALFATGNTQKAAIIELIRGQKAFEYLAKILTMQGVGKNAFADYINTNSGALAQLKTRIDAAVVANRDLVINNTKGQGFLIPAKDAKIYKKALEDLLKAQKDYNAQQRILNMLGLADTTAAEEKAAKAAEARRKALDNVKKAIKDYVKQVKDAIMSSISLSNAFSDAQNQQEDAAKTLNDALAARAEAYATLNRLENDRYANAKDLVDAQNAVADAEAKVQQVRQQPAPPNYTQIFREQIQAAKDFAGYIKQLKQQKISDAALQQILSLGPVAGSQVAKDLLAGTAGMTVGSLNADLASVAQVSTQAALTGLVTSGGTVVGTQGGGAPVYITVTSADPNAVVDALKKYQRTNGAVPIKVTNK